MLILGIYLAISYLINTNKFDCYYLYRVTHHTREIEKCLIYLISLNVEYCGLNININLFTKNPMEANKQNQEKICWANSDNKHKDTLSCHGHVVSKTTR